jgi:hypothetical protein
MPDHTLYWRKRAERMEQERDEWKAAAEYENAEKTKLLLRPAQDVERLREERDLERRRNILHPESTEYITELETELERLRETLKTIADASYCKADSHRFTDATCPHHFPRRIAERALAALTQEEPDA